MNCEVSSLFRQKYACQFASIWLLMCSIVILSRFRGLECSKRKSWSNYWNWCNFCQRFDRFSRFERSKTSTLIQLAIEYAFLFWRDISSLLCVRTSPSKSQKDQHSTKFLTTLSVFWFISSIRTPNDLNVGTKRSSECMRFVEKRCFF